MTDSERQRRLLEAQVERWTSEAKKLIESGNDVSALELYRRAADELSGAPWLQHRTADLARKIGQADVAIAYFRRAAVAFQLAEFPKRAVPPLRTAWTLAVEGLPGTCKVLVDVALESMQVQRRLGFTSDATVTLERTNAALRARGFSEIGRAALEQRATPSTRSLLPGAKSHLLSSSPPESEVTPRSSASQPEGSPGSGGRALTGLSVRR